MTEGFRHLHNSCCTCSSASNHCAGSPRDFPQSIPLGRLGLGLGCRVPPPSSHRCTRGQHLGRSFPRCARADESRHRLLSMLSIRTNVRTRSSPRACRTCPCCRSRSHGTSPPAELHTRQLPGRSGESGMRFPHHSSLNTRPKQSTPPTDHPCSSHCSCECCTPGAPLCDWPDNARHPCEALSLRIASAQIGRAHV